MTIEINPGGAIFPEMETENLRRLEVYPDGKALDVRTRKELRVKARGTPQLIVVDPRRLESRTRDGYEKYINFRLREKAEDVRANGYCYYDGISISSTGSEYPLNIFVMQFYKIEGDERLPKVPRF